MIYGPSAKQAINRRGKTRIRKFVVRRLVRHLLYLYCLPDSGSISVHAKRLQISDARQKQNESIWIRCEVTLSPHGPEEDN